MNMNEKEYKELYKYSLQAAYHYVGYQEEAYDLAQNALLSFFSSNAQIESPQAWIKVIMRREASKFFDRKSRETHLRKSIQNEVRTPSEDNLETDRILALNSTQVKKMLSSSDYQIYRKLKKAKFSVQNYSVREEISYNTAKNHRMRIKRNILAALLWEEGWRTGTKILSYTQYYNIQRFINTLIEAVHANKLSDLIHYTSQADDADVMRVLSGVKECVEWSVSHQSAKYRTILSFRGIDDAPSFCLLDIVFEQNNTINIVHVYNPTVIFDGYGDLDPLKRHLEKGKLAMNNAEYLQCFQARICSPIPTP